MATVDAEGAPAEEDDDGGPDPYLALRAWGGWRGWSAWLVAHALTAVLVLAGWVVLLTSGVAIAAVFEPITPSYVIKDALAVDDPDTPRKILAAAAPTFRYLLPVLAVSVVTAHVGLVVLGKACRPHTLAFADEVYVRALRARDREERRRRRRWARTTFRQLHSRQRREARLLAAAAAVLGVAAAVLVWSWSTWPWEGDLSVGRRTEVVALGVLAGVLLGPLLLVAGAGGAMVLVIAFSGLLLAPERWLGRVYADRLGQGRPRPQPRPRAPSRSGTWAADGAAPVAGAPHSAVRAGGTTAGDGTDPPSLGLLVWLCADLLPDRRLPLQRWAPVPGRSGKVALNRTAAHVLAADVLVLQARGHVRLHVRPGRVGVQRLVRRGRGLRVQQQLYDAPVIDLDARLGDDLTGRAGDIGELDSQVSAWLGNTCEDPRRAVLEAVMEEARALGLLRPSRIPAEDGDEPSGGRRTVEHWDRGAVEAARRAGEPLVRDWLRTVRACSGADDVAYDVVHRRCMSALRAAQSPPEVGDGPWVAMALTLGSRVHRRLRRWPANGP